MIFIKEFKVKEKSGRRLKKLTAKAQRRKVKVKLNSSANMFIYTNQKTSIYRAYKPKLRF